MLKEITSRKALFLFLLLGAIVYGNGIFNKFLGDDNGLIVNNPVLHSVANIRTFFAGGSFYGGVTDKLVGIYYKPITNTFLSLIYTYFGPNFVAFHSFQILLHITNSFIVFLLFTHFFKKPLALALSLIFLVHPLNSEAVFYISATQDVLFFLFGMSALLLTMAKSGSRSLLGAIPFLILSLLTKETGVIFLVVTSIYVFLYRKRQFILSLGLSGLILLGYIWVRFKTVGIFVNPANSPIGHLDLVARILNMPLILFFYIKTFLLPFSLASSYRWAHKTVDFAHVFLPLFIDLVFLGTCVAGAIFLHQKKSLAAHLKAYIFFGLWLELGLLLHLQILPLDVTVADRWFYFPMVGILGMIGAVMTGVKVNFPKTRAQAVFVVLLILLAVRTFSRSFDYRDYFTLATHDLVISPEAYDLEDVIGLEYLQRGRLDAARTHMEKSIQIYPNFQNYNNLGLLLFREGKYREAQEAFRKSLHLGEMYTVYENLAVIGLVLEDHQNNILFIKQGVKKFPQSAKLWTILAIEQYTLNQYADAKSAISNAYLYDQGPSTQYYYDAILRQEPLKTEIGIR